MRRHIGRDRLLLMRAALPEEDFLYYIQIGEIWFLQACLLPGYKIEQLKQLAV